VSEVAQGPGPGPGWWQAADGKWYPPGTQPAPPSGTGSDAPFDPNSPLWQQGQQSPGAAPLPPFQASAPAQYCVTCGNGLVATAAICPRCGTPVSRMKPGQVGAKSRTAAVLLAVFLSFWSFLYTYRTSAWKFWLGLGLTVFSFIVGEIIVSTTNNPAGAVAWSLVALGVWIWSIVDRSTTPL
jgi:hypothetical protein